MKTHQEEIFSFPYYSARDVSGLFQLNKLATVSYQSVDGKEVKNQRLYPKMEVTLSLDDFKDKNEGYQKKMEEPDRLKLYNVFTK